jgi:CHAT domain-containing protein
MRGVGWRRSFSASSPFKPPADPLPAERKVHLFMAMKLLPGLVLTLTLLLHFAAPNRNQQQDGLRTAVWQGQTETTITPTTVEGRKNALRELEELIRLALSEGRTVDAARHLNRAGSLHLLLNDPAAALASHTQALDLLRQTPNAEVQVDNLVGTATACLNLPDKKELAQQALDQALSLSRQSGYTRGQAEALLTLSALQNRDQHATALATAQQALALWTTLNDQDGLARSHIKIGTYYLAQNLVIEATENFLQALELWRALNNKAQEAEALIMLGFIEHRKGQWAAAVDYYTQAHGLIDAEAEPDKMGQIAAGVGAALNESGLPEEGVVQYQRALGHYQRARDLIGIHYAVWGIGRSYYLHGDLTQAANYLQQSLELVEPDSLLAAMSLEYLGRVQLARAEYVTAIQGLESALNIYTKAQNPQEAARVTALLGQAYDGQTMLSRAEGLYDRALKEFIRLGDRVNQADVYYALGRLALKKENYEAARSHLEHSITLTEDIRRASTSDELTASFSATVQDRYEAYVECLMRTHEQQPAKGLSSQAFEISERGRARALSELLFAVQTISAPGVEPQLLAQEKSLRQTLRVMENAKIKLLAQNDREKLTALDKQMAQLEADYTTVSEKIRSHYPSFDRINRTTAWNLRQIQETLLADDDAVLLEYSLGAYGSYAWTVTRNEIKSHKLAPQSEIDEAARQVHFLLSKQPATDTEKLLTQAIARLSELIVAPLASALNRQRIIVVADDALHYVPFQILSTSANQEPLMVQYEIVNVPSASVLGQLRAERSKRSPAARLLAAFGHPVLPADYAQRLGSTGENLVAQLKAGTIQTWQRALRDIDVTSDSFDPSQVQPLLYSELELANLRTIGGAESLIATGFDASRQTLENTDLSQYAILHLATHAILDPKRPEISGFLMSMVDREGKSLDGFVTVTDVYRLQVPVDLVVLSACSTGLGKEVRGEGLIGLTRGFMHAGASSVAATLWKVDDEAASELMKHFYSNMLQNQMTPAAALRAAQNTLRQSAEWRSPHYWAAFTLQGEYDRKIRVEPDTSAPRTVRNIVLAAIVLFLLAGFGWWYWRRRKVRSI